LKIETQVPEVAVAQHMAPSGAASMIMAPQACQKRFGCAPACMQILVQTSPSAGS
jgi:hypothetical protein